MMKAIEFQFKSNAHKIVNDVTKPIPAKDEVLIKVVNSALDTAHQPIIDKEFPTAYFIHKVKAPLYLGYHYSGIIEGLGSDVVMNDVDLKKGVAVFGFLQYEPSQSQGAFAEYITVKHNECAMKPKNVSFEVAAASTTEAITALQAIRDKGGLRMRSESSKSKEQEQQTILVVGAAGGVGSAAVQIAKNLLGAHVTAVCSSKDVQTVKEVFGADVVLDRSMKPNYMKRLLNDKKTKFDVILDAPCVLPSSATKLLKPKGGVMVTTLPTATLVWNMLKLVFSSKKATWVECHSNRDDLDSIGSLLSTTTTAGSGSDHSRLLNIPIDSTFKVKDMPAAMAKQAGKKTGRVVIQVEKGWN